MANALKKTVTDLLNPPWERQYNAMRAALRHCFLAPVVVQQKNEET